MSIDSSRAYREASVRVRTVAEEHGVSLSDRDVTKVVRRYGIRKNAGDSVSSARTGSDVYSETNFRALSNDTDLILERIERDAGNGELLARCRAQEIRTLNTSARYDDIDRLQRFARIHNKTELTSAQAEAILKSHKGLMDRSPAQISDAITKHQAGSVFKAGGKNALRIATVVTGIVKAANDEEGSGVDTKGTSSAASDAAREKYREKSKIRKIEEKRAAKKAEAKEQLDKLNAESNAHSPKSTGRMGSDSIKKTPSPRQNKAVGKNARNAANVTKTRSVFGAEDVKAVQEARAAQQTKNVQALRRKRTVKNLIGKRKAREKAAEGAKEGLKAALSKFAEGSSASSSSSSLIAGAKFVLIAVIAVVLIQVILVCAIAMFIVVIVSNNGQGDWYDPQLCARTDFVEVTQDLQRKYYDDCLMLAYRYGADTPTYEDVEINWDEVYALWSVLVKYRSGNKNMEKVFSSGSGKATGYSEGAAVFDLKVNPTMLFDSSNQAYLQDFYLAFYSMYYDMKALDDHGNPIVINIVNDERYVPYYPSTDGNQKDYKFFNSSNGYPLVGEISKKVEKDLIYLNADGEWCISDAYKDRCFFAFASTRGSGTDGTADGCFNRGLPKVKIVSESVTQTYTPDAKDVDVKVWYCLDWDGNGNCKPTTGAVYNAFSGDDWSYDVYNGNTWEGTWSIDYVQKEIDGEFYDVSGEEADDAVDATGGYIYFGSGIVSEMREGCSICNAGYTFGAAVEHYHHGYWLYAGTISETRQDDDVEVDVTDTRMILPNPTAIDGLDALHDVYDELKFYDVRTGPYNLAGHHTLSGQRVIEAGTKAKSSAIAVVLNQIFDRSEMMPWDTKESRWSSGAPSDLFAFGLPEASSGSHDCYGSISSSLNGIRASMLTNGYSLPNQSALHAAIDSGSDGKLGYSNIYEMMLASVDNAQYTFPFYVTRSRWDPNESYRRGDIIEDDSDAYNVLSFSRGKQKISWTSTTYLMYRYLIAEQELSSPAACGVLGALQLETSFSTYGYKAIDPADNNGCYALGLLQWNDGSTEWRADHTNLYEQVLAKWCLANGYNWQNAGAQLRYLDFCFAGGGGATGNYPAGIQGCKNVGSLPFPSTVSDSGYYTNSNMPTYSAVDSAACYEACWYWGVKIEIGVEQVGGTFNDSIFRSGYGPVENVFGLDGGAHTTGGVSYHEPEPNMEKQRMVASQMFLRYIAGSDPNYCPIVVLSE